MNLKIYLFFIFILSPYLAFSQVIPFGSQQVIDKAPEKPQTISTPDIDDDGRPDILSCSQGSNKIYWYKNKGGGNFSSQKIISDQVNMPTEVFAADLNGDNNQDVYSISKNDNKVAWYENLGNGNFSSQKIISDSVDNGRTVYAADLNNDEHIDIVAGSKNRVLWYKNDGDGNFTHESISKRSYSNIYSIYAANLNSDNLKDILVSYSDNADNKSEFLGWYKNEGNGNFDTLNKINKESKIEYAYKVHVADIDDDNDPDPIVSSGDGPVNTYTYYNELSWFENTGSGFAPKKTVIADEINTEDVYPVDLDKDGLMDVVTMDVNESEIIVYYNEGNGKFSDKNVISSAADKPSHVYAEDMDADGDIDLLSTSANDNKIAWYENLNQNANFVISNINPCIKEKIGITNKTKDADSYTWSFGNDANIQSSDKENPDSIFYENSGKKEIKLIINESGPKEVDSITKELEVKDCTPKADFNVADTVICYKRTLNFSNNSQGNDNTYEWKVKNDIKSTEENFKYTFDNDTGSFNVTLTINKNTVNENKYTQTIHVNKCSKAAFTYGDTLCTDSVITFDASNSKKASSYDWSFGGKGKISSHAFSEAKAHDVTLTINKGEINEDTYTETLNIESCKPSSADFSISNKTPCIKEKIKITNKSEDADSYTWSFGNDANKESSDKKNPDDIFYNKKGEQTIKLIINKGKDSEAQHTETIQVKGCSDANFSYDPQKPCKDSVITFDATGSKKANSYSWRFGEGAEPATEESDSIVEVHYSTGGSKQVILEINGGNAPGARDTQYVEVMTKEAGISIISDKENICKGQPITFNAQIKGASKGTGTITWKIDGKKETEGNSFETNGDSLSDGGVITAEFSSPSLKCVANNKISTTKTINIKDTDPVFISEIMGPDSICNGNTYTFKVENNNDNADLTWNIPDGTIKEMGANTNKLELKVFNFNQKRDSIILTKNNSCEKVKASKMVYKKCPEIFVPNSFTPGRDDGNVAWYIPGLNKYNNSEVKVYNRWGALIYHTSGTYKPWKGKKFGTGKKLPAATYYYIIKRYPTDDNPQTGTVTILK